MPKPFVFTLMPFHESFNDTYKLGIKAAVEEAGGYCERVDEQVYEERMLDRIYNQINKADFIIADVTGKNPNVFYEIGYAHALNKKVILLAADDSDIPFDLKHHYHIVYKSKITYLKEQLFPRLQWYFSNPDKRLQSYSELDFYIDDIKIEQNSIVNLKPFKQFGGTDHIQFIIRIENNREILFSNRLLLGFIFPSEYSLSGFERNLKVKILSQNETMHTYTNYMTDIFPGDYIRLPRCIIHFKSGAPITASTIPSRLRIFKEEGMTDIDFNIVTV